MSEKPAWVAELKRFEQPSVRKASLQIADTLVPYLALLTIMYFTVVWRLPYWATLLISIPAGGFLVRLFILFHDCCHGSFVPTQRFIKILGNILGVFVFTPFADFRHTHGIHHSTSGNLDRRGVGDVWTMTVDEYAASSLVRRLAYRAFRNPFIMFGLGPLYTFLINHRIPRHIASRAQLMNVLYTDAALAAVVVAASLLIGVKTYVMVQLPVLFFGGMGGIWLFYIQHQFDPAYWARSEEWESMEAALQGSSYYKLPAVLQWFAGNIGYHHVHHLRPRIPNYNLRRCVMETPELQLPDPLTLWPSLKSVRLNIWDERRKTLLSFGEMRRQLRGEKRALLLAKLSAPATPSRPD